MVMIFVFHQTKISIDLTTESWVRISDLYLTTENFTSWAIWNL